MLAAVDSTAIAVASISALGSIIAAGLTAWIAYQVRPTNGRRLGAVVEDTNQKADAAAALAKETSRKADVTSHIVKRTLGTRAADHELPPHPDEPTEPTEKRVPRRAPGEL